MSESLLLEARFFVSATSKSTWPEVNGAEVAFVGRSNVGKSSVLNTLTGRQSLARKSKTPGRTRLINFFSIAPKGYLVDLPGYGYAKVSKNERKQWQGNIEVYLREREALACVVLIIDIRHLDQALDEVMVTWLHTLNLPTHILLNKADKLGFGAKKNALNKYQSYLKKNALGFTCQLFSCHDKTGVDEAVEKIKKVMGECSLEDQG